MLQYLIYAWDGEDGQALERRMASRPAHFEGAREMKKNGNFVSGGAILNKEGKMIGSMMVVQFETEQGLQDWMAKEPYIMGKVWEKIDIHPFRVADV